jgi:AraC-like DNA-binding protein
MERLQFSSDDFPTDRDDRSRFALWCDLFAAHYGSKEITRDETLPFNARFQFLSLGTVGVGVVQGPFDKIMNAGNHTDAFALAINKSSTPITYSCRDRDVTVEPNMASLILLDEPGGGRRRPAVGNEWFPVLIKRQRLAEAVANAEDLVAQPIRNDGLLGYLTHYLSLLFNPNVEVLDDRLIAHVDATIFDLIVLLLGANRDAAAIAAGRGLRAARLRAVLSELSRGFASATFSAQDVAARLGLSSRYVYELLHESGVGFTERVLELRLQRARGLLGTPRYDSVKISEIAYMAGFNEASYFNRRFRRRFGMTPTEARAHIPSVRVTTSGKDR